MAACRTTRRETGDSGSNARPCDLRRRMPLIRCKPLIRTEAQFLFAISRQRDRIIVAARKKSATFRQRTLALAGNSWAGRLFNFSASSSLRAPVQ